MRIMCRLCKKNRNSKIILYHNNPDKTKYYCLQDGDLTDAEWKRELIDTNKDKLSQ